MLSTYLMNSTLREYIHLGAKYPAKTGECLAILEARCGWDLRMHFIYVNHSSTTYEYKDVGEAVYGKVHGEEGGEVIHETFDLI